MRRRPLGRRLVVTTGTPVLIFGTYDDKAPPPWIDLTAASQGVQLPAFFR